MFSATAHSIIEQIIKKSISIEILPQETYNEGQDKSGQRSEMRIYMTIQQKYQIDTKENKQFLETARRELLSFGHHFPSPEGSSYYLGDDGTPWKDRNRETWITSRMAHVYSLGCFLGHDGSKELAAVAIHGLRSELHDKKNGGWYAGLTSDGEIVPTKQLCPCLCDPGGFFRCAGRNRRCQGTFGGGTYSL